MWQIFAGWEICCEGGATHECRQLWAITQYLGEKLVAPLDRRIHAWGEQANPSFIPSSMEIHFGSEKWHNAANTQRKKADQRSAFFRC
jgi:hypothetical protein